MTLTYNKQSELEFDLDLIFSISCKLCKENIKRDRMDIEAHLKVCYLSFCKQTRT